MVNDVLGIGEWQAARVNERSEIMNELNHPLVSWTGRMGNGVLSMEITPLGLTWVMVLYLMAVYGDDIVAMVKGWMENIMGNPQTNPDTYNPQTAVTNIPQGLIPAATGVGAIDPLSVLTGGGPFTPSPSIWKLLSGK